MKVILKPRAAGKTHELITNKDWDDAVQYVESTPIEKRTPSICFPGIVEALRVAFKQQDQNGHLMENLCRARFDIEREGHKDERREE